VCPGDAHLARHNGKTGKVPLDAEDQGVARTYSSIGCGMLVSFFKQVEKKVQIAFFIFRHFPGSSSVMFRISN
jgi:hypothetical protein